MARKKTLDERYRDALRECTPAMSQIIEMAAVGRAAISTARAWVSGKQRPSAAAMELLSQHYKMSADKLFSPGHFDKAEDYKSKN